jgi:hypothetical protein
VGIILGSLLFFSNYLSSYAELATKAGETPGETLDIVIPLPTISGQEHRQEQELTSQQQWMTRDVIEENSNQETADDLVNLAPQREMIQQNEEEAEILEQQEEDDSSITSTSNTMQEWVQEELNNDQDTNDEEGKQVNPYDVNNGIPLELPFP